MALRHWPDTFRSYATRHILIVNTHTLGKFGIRPGELSLLVVDYIGKVKPADSRKETREQIAQVSGDLKTLAKRLC